MSSSEVLLSGRSCQPILDGPNVLYVLLNFTQNWSLNQSLQQSFQKRCQLLLRTATSFFFLIRVSTAKESKLLFLFCFVGRTQRMWKFLGRGSNLCHSSNPSRCSNNTDWILNLLYHKRTPSIVYPFIFYFFMDAPVARGSSRAKDGNPRHSCDNPDP